MIWARRWFSDRFFRAQVIAWLQCTGVAIGITLVGRGVVEPEVLGRIPWFLPTLILGAVAGAWLSPRLPRDVFGRAVGLPTELGGIPLDELGATGFGLAHAAEVAAPYCDLELAGARVAVQGFGAVGIHGARFLCEKGAVLVAASEISGNGAAW